MNRQELTDEVTSRLDIVERRLDDTIAELADLTGYLTRGRQEAGFAASIGHEAAAAMGEALNGMMACRGRIIDAHHDLAVVGRKFSLKPTAFLGGDKSPTDSALAPTALRAVG